MARLLFFVITDKGLVEGGMERFGVGCGELLDQLVVELLAIEIGFDHTDTDGIAKRKNMAGLATDEAEVLVIEVKGFVA